MAWFLLLIAGLLEVGWSVGLKFTDGFSRPIPTALTVISMVASVVLLGLAVKTLPLGTAYAIWTGIGAVGAFLVGLFVLGEPAGFLRITSVMLILAGLVGLKLSAG